VDFDSLWHTRPRPLIKSQVRMQRDEHSRPQQNFEYPVIDGCRVLAGPLFALHLKTVIRLHASIWDRYAFTLANPSITRRLEADSCYRQELNSKACGRHSPLTEDSDDAGWLILQLMSMFRGRAMQHKESRQAQLQVKRRQGLVAGSRQLPE